MNILENFYVDKHDEIKIREFMYLDFNRPFIYFNNKSRGFDGLKKIIGGDDNIFYMISNIFYIYSHTYFLQNNEYRTKSLPVWFISKYGTYIKMAKY